MRYVAALLLLLCAPGAHAQNWFNSGGLSYHLTGHNKPNDETVSDGQQQREKNPGIGVEKQLSNDRFLGTGIYLNSHNRESFYVSYGYRPIQLNKVVSLGFIAGLVTGYPDQSRLPYGIMPVLAPMMSFEDKKSRLGANLIIAPKPPLNKEAIIILQFKYMY